MELLDQIRTGRAIKRGKKPLPETVFSAVAAIVKKYDTQEVPKGGGGTFHPEIKPGDRLSLFPLLSKAQLRLTRKIIETYDNHYLIHARSPEDFERSRQLFERNPDLPLEVLQEFSLDALLKREMEQTQSGQEDSRAGGNTQIKL